MPRPWGREGKEAMQLERVHSERKKYNTGLVRDAGPELSALSD